MACASCAKQGHYVSVRREFVAPVVDQECHFTQEEIESKKNALKEEKLTATPARITRISYDIYRLNRALKYYDTDCNKFLKDLYEIISG